MGVVNNSHAQIVRHRRHNAPPMLCTSVQYVVHVARVLRDTSRPGFAPALTWSACPLSTTNH